jgi:hypothetical protein
MNKSIPTTNKRDYEEAEQEIHNVLADGQWHRARELEEKTRLSPATLSKHLKRDLRISVERKISRRGKEYPRPVYYRLQSSFKQKLEKAQFLNTSAEQILNSPTLRISFLLRGASLMAISYLKDYEAGKLTEELLGWGLESALWIFRSNIIKTLGLMKEYKEKGLKTREILDEVEHLITCQR